MVSIPEVSLTAKEMGQAISVVAEKLLEFDILSPNGYAVLCDEAQRLRVGRDSLSWNLHVSRENAIIFSEALDKNCNVIIPSITCEGIVVHQGDHACPPFQALDVAIEIFNFERKPIARWHVDWANVDDIGKIQPGPLVHLQYGGHFSGFRDLDPVLKEPRWCHPPMDLILLCEVMAANFFEDRWETLREDQNWCEAVATSQRFCYSAYLRKIVAGMSATRRTLLHSMWASEWLKERA